MGSYVFSLHLSPALYTFTVLALAALSYGTLCAYIGMKLADAGTTLRGIPAVIRGNGADSTAGFNSHFLPGAESADWDFPPTPPRVNRFIEDGEFIYSAAISTPGRTRLEPAV